jgi:hypothetical protein
MINTKVQVVIPLGDFLTWLYRYEWLEKPIAKLEQGNSEVLARIHLKTELAII